MLMQLRDYKQHSTASSLVNIASHKSKDLNSQTVLISSTNRLDQLNGNGCSHSDDSSSDEELRDPVEDHLPNLSDDDSCRLDATSLQHFSGLDKNCTEKSNSLNTEIPVGIHGTAIPLLSTDLPNQLEDKQTSLNAFDEKNNNYCVKKSTDHSTVKMLKEFGRKLEKNNNKTSNGSMVLHPNVKKLPYVSRGTRDSCDELNLKRATISSTEEERLKENVFLAAPKSISSGVLANKGMYSKNGDFCLTKTLYCRSQTSSGSLSSGSNASSVGLTDLRSSPSGKELNGLSSTSSRSETQIDNDDVFSSELVRAASSSDCALVSNCKDHSVFSTVSTSSCQSPSLIHSTDQSVSTSKVLNIKQQELSENTQTKQISPLSDDPLKRLAATQATKLPTRTKPHSIKEINELENCNNSSYDAIGVNSISMVEHSTSPGPKIQATSGSNGVKMRFPAASKQSKKNAASRNSRAFALQAKKMEECSSKSPTTTDIKGLSRRPRSEMLDITQRMISSDIRRRTASLSPNSFASGQLASCRKEISASLANLNCEDSSESNLNTVVEASSLDLSPTSPSSFFQDENSVTSNGDSVDNKKSNPTHQPFYNSSAWSLSHGSIPNQGSRVRRRLSLHDRLKGAFSFQNIRKAISMERLDEEERSSNSYLNEFGEDISQACSKRSHSSQQVKSSNPLRKASSIASIFNTVRMRKRKSRERRAAKLRNTIAIDPKQIPEYECISEIREQPNKPCHSDGEVGNPAHFRPIGRVLQMNVNQGTMLIEMTKPPSGPFGFYLARNKENGGVYISSMSDSYPDKMYSGLMKLGDEITEVNGKGADELSLEEIYNLILDNNRIILKIKPARVHSV